jgi:hypothetical protein
MGANVDHICIEMKLARDSYWGLSWCKKSKEKIALIRKRMLTGQSRQKSCADKNHRELEFAIGDLIYLKVSPM